MLELSFFNRDACKVAAQLLGKILYRKHEGYWLRARIIETEAYYLDEKGSHASLGFTEKREALFMPAGTIYMYYARGKDSLNISTCGKGNAVLIKSAFPAPDEATIEKMQQLNPSASGGIRPIEKLCNGQTLLCQSLDIKVADWDKRTFDKELFYIDDTQTRPAKTIQTRRLGIPEGRDEHLMYRFIDYDYARFCTSNPLTKRKWRNQIDYLIKEFKEEK